jgi:CSLREA domain-containing protein
MSCLRRRSLAALALTTALVLAAATSASARTFGVNSPNDVGDGLCDAAHCSLRDAIQAANATAGVDQILHNVETITPRTPLPPITEAVRVNARPDGRCFFDTLVLQLDGEGADFPGLVFAPGSGGSVICLVNVRGFANGIEFQSNDNAIRFSTIGTSLDATAADPNSESGILITGDNNLIGGKGIVDRNVISGNALHGVSVDASADGTRIEGNLIGTDASGGTAIANGFGVDVAEAASETTVGGPEPGAGNVISGNIIGVNSADGRVVGNLIGLDVTGTAALPNFGPGVLALGPIQIGGRSEAERNVIGGQEIADVVLQGRATVQGNWIGVAADGAELPGDAARTNGIRLLEGSDGATIGGTENGEGNVIAGHRVGVESADSASGFSVHGNLIGLAPDGTTQVPTGTGIRIGADTTGAQVGGVQDGAGNTVAGGGDTGIAVAGERTRIEGNTVGLDQNGNDDVAPQGSGIVVQGTAEGTTIGGDSQGAGNTISGNFLGVELLEGSAGTIVEGNLIGTDRDGRDPRPNDIGVSIGDEALGGERIEARIGGTRSAQRNVISGNDVGVSSFCTKADVVIEGNSIGVGADGSAALGNGTGLLLGCDRFIAPAPAADDGIVVGGTAPGAGNRIAHNNGDDLDPGDGVEVSHTSGGVMILGNEIFANDSGLARDPGIDLFDDGVSANGSQPGDVQPAFPVLTNVDLTSAGTLVQGTIDYPAGRDVRLEFFSNPSCDASGHGEGQTPLGSLTLTGSGAPAAFGARVAAAPAGHAITATATDLGLHRTSEFSRCAIQTGGPPPADPPPGDPPPGPGSSDPPPPGPVVAGPAPPLGIPVIDVPRRPRCKVPNVVGLTLKTAKRRLTIAGCGVGKVTRPKRRPGRRFRLVVKRTSLRAGAIRPPGAAIGLTLKFKRVKTRRP